MNHRDKRLFLFDMDGTLIRSFMREGHRGQYDRVEALPGRIPVIRALRMTGVAHFGIITNQAGVAFGYQTEDQVRNKIARVIDLFWAPVHQTSWHVCFTHDNASVRDYLTEGIDRRKPSPAMLQEAILDHAMIRERAIYIGDRPEDQEAALRACVDFAWARDFFGVDETCDSYLTKNTAVPIPCRLELDHVGRHRFMNQRGTISWER